MKKFEDLEPGDRVGFLRFLPGGLTLENLHVLPSLEIGDDGCIIWVPGLCNNSDDGLSTYYNSPEEHEYLVSSYQVAEIFYKFFV